MTNSVGDTLSMCADGVYSMTLLFQCVLTEHTLTIVSVVNTVSVCADGAYTDNRKCG